MDGKLSREEFTKAFNLAVDGAMQVYEIQKKALLEGSTEVEK
jgi:ribonuclease PH